jgi:hypothetical protein
MTYIYVHPSCYPQLCWSWFVDFAIDWANGRLGRCRGVGRDLRLRRDVAVGVGVAVEQFNASKRLHVAKHHTIFTNSARIAF